MLDLALELPAERVLAGVEQLAAGRLAPLLDPGTDAHSPESAH